MMGVNINNLDLCTVLTLILVFLITFFVWNFLSGDSVKIPGPTTLPIVGNLLNIIGTKHVAETFIKLQKKHGDLVLLRIGSSRPTVIIFGYQRIREILVDNASKTMFRPSELPALKRMLPNVPGIVFSNGKEWMEIRKLTVAAMKDAGVGKKSIEKIIRKEIQFLGDLIANTSDKNPIDASQEFSKATCNVISSIIFGSRFSYDDPQLKYFVEFINLFFNNVSPFVPEAIFQILGKFGYKSKIDEIVKIRKELQNYVRSRIDQQRTTFDPRSTRNFLDLYLQQENKQDSNISEEHLFMTILDLYVAGTDTTSAALQWCMLYMLKYPDVQTKCRNEILEVTGDRLPELKDKDKLPYVMATISEVQRIATIVPNGTPHYCNEEIHIDGKTIPKGTTIICSLQSVHRDPTMWVEPDAFRPDRFLGKDGQFLKHEAFSPFSMGPRICPGKQLAGAEMVLFFTSILQRFDLVKAEKDDDLRTDGVHTGVTQKPHPFRIRFVPRR